MAPDWAAEQQHRVGGRQGEHGLRLPQLRPEEVLEAGGVQQGAAERVPPPRARTRHPHPLQAVGGGRGSVQGGGNLPRDAGKEDEKG